jgi:hypothetical protein
VKRGSGKSTGRLTQADAIRRQQQIVQLRDVGRLTFARVSEEVGIGEKEVRLAYYRYVNEVAPLIAAPAAEEQIAEALRTLDGAAQCLWDIAEKGENENARVGAVRTLIDLTFRGIELRQHVGLLPRPASQVVDHAWMAEQILRVFEKHLVPPEAMDEIQQVFNEAKKGAS